MATTVGNFNNEFKDHTVNGCGVSMLGLLFTGEQQVLIKLWGLTLYKISVQSPFSFTFFFFCLFSHRKASWIE